MVLRLAVSFSKNKQMRFSVPAFVRDQLFDGVKSVELDLDKDDGGMFLKVRPVKYRKLAESQ